MQSVLEAGPSPGRSLVAQHHGLMWHAPPGAGVEWGCPPGSGDNLGLGHLWFMFDLLSCVPDGV